MVSGTGGIPLICSFTQGDEAGERQHIPCLCFVVVAPPALSPCHHFSGYSYSPR